MCLREVSGTNVHDWMMIYIKGELKPIITGG